MPRKVMRPKGWDPKKNNSGWLQPKIDGVRMYNPEGTALARTMKLHRNRHVTAMFSNPMYIGFDGEVAAELETHSELCRLTSSAMSRADGEPFVLWHIFDFVTEDTHALPYSMRYAEAKRRISELQSKSLGMQLRLVPYVECRSLEEVEAAHARYITLGYEGSCLWHPDVVHKAGDSSPTHKGCVRIKDFVHSEARILRLIEGDHNGNVAQVNELGRTFRTSHQEGKIPNGMLGAFEMEQLEDLYDENDKKKLLVAKGEIFMCAPGLLDHKARVHALANPHLYLDQIGKYKLFPKGIKDKPRFPQFDSVRSKEDL
jgi:DNA ligase-1